MVGPVLLRVDLSYVLALTDAREGSRAECRSVPFRRSRPRLVESNRTPMRRSISGFLQGKPVLITLPLLHTRRGGRTRSGGSLRHPSRFVSSSGFASRLDSRLDSPFPFLPPRPPRPGPSGRRPAREGTARPRRRARPRARRSSHRVIWRQVRRAVRPFARFVSFRFVSFRRGGSRRRRGRRNAQIGFPQISRD